MATSGNINRRYIESIHDEPKKMLQPIAGYEKVTVKSLDDACGPIKNLFDQSLTQNIAIAKMNSTTPANGLSPDESASIHLYTMEWSEHEHSLYVLLNRTLRQADRTKLQAWFKYLKLLLTAFFKLPSSEHTLVWRGVREDLSTLYPKDKEFAWWAFSSCASSIEVLESSSYLGKTGARTIFSIQTDSGKDIRTHSYYENEDEILLPPGLYLRVVGCLSPAKDLQIIHLREISPPFPLLEKPFDLGKSGPTVSKFKPPPAQEKYPTYDPAQLWQPSSKKKEPPFPAPKKTSPYSDQELNKQHFFTFWF